VITLKVIEQFNKLFSNIPPVAIRIDVSWNLAKELYQAIQNYRKQNNTTIVEEQYSLILVQMLLMASGEQIGVNESEE